METDRARHAEHLRKNVLSQDLSHVSYTGSSKGNVWPKHKKKSPQEKGGETWGLNPYAVGEDSIMVFLMILL
jgi:hypothetical protein